MDEDVTGFTEFKRAGLPTAPGWRPRPWPLPGAGSGLPEVGRTAARAAVRTAGRTIARVDGWQAALAGTFLVALVVRGRHVLLAGAPLNDGGMFASMSRDIQHAGYVLPAFTTYNSADIPFAYPPLALYLAALVEAATPLSMVDVYWLLPFGGALLAVAAFYLLARTIFDERLVPILATLAFALVPRAFEWLIMGGGATRGLGLAAALASMAAFRQASGQRSRRWLGGATLLAAATLLSHMEAAVFLACGLALVVLGRRDRWTLLAGTTAALGTAVATAPWWALVLARHGFSPFLASVDHGGTLLATGETPNWVWLQLIDPVSTSEPFFSFVGAMGALGALLALAHGRWLLPAWWGLVILTHMRGFATFAAVPTALLAGYLVAEVGVPAARRAVRRAGRRSVGRWRVGIVTAGILVVMFYAAVEPNRGEARYLRPVSDGDVRAMAWISNRTGADARFLVIPRQSWFVDREGEWFPVLTERTSLGTPQGTEWLEGEFGLRASLHHRARGCASKGAACLEAIATTVPFTHVYLPAGCCSALRESLRMHPRYVARYLGGAAVFERLPATNRPVRTPTE